MKNYSSILTVSISLTTLLIFPLLFEEYQYYNSFRDFGPPILISILAFWVNFILWNVSHWLTKLSLKDGKPLRKYFRMGLCYLLLSGSLLFIGFLQDDHLSWSLLGIVKVLRIYIPVLIPYFIVGFIIFKRQSHYDESGEE